MYDVEEQAPAFFHITPASTNDIKAMPEIPYEKGAYYIFDRGYNDFANLFNIEQIEATFVVRAKRNLQFKIKKFRGTSENAVRVQIYCAIITYCLVVIIKHDMQLDRSAYEILQMTGISLTDKTHLRDLFDKSNFNNFKELFQIFSGH